MFHDSCFIKMFKPNKNQILLGVAIAAIVVTVALVSLKSVPGNVLSFLTPAASPDVIAKKSVDYLNKSVLQQGQTAELVSFSEESGVVKMKIKIGATTYDSYATRDGKFLFPEAFTLNGATPAPAANGQPAAQAPANTADVAKVTKTSLEAFVVADCPFGLQADRAIVQAIKAAPALADYIKIRFIGSASGNNITSMHDGGQNGLEAKENERQICIREQQPAKFISYLECYIQKSAGALPNSMPIGDSTGCLTKTKVDVAKVNACMSDPAQGVAYLKADYALADKYGVQGSPTFVLNGKQVTETPFGGRSAKGMGQMVCASSVTPPAFCQGAKFSTDQAATSFSLTYAGAGATGATANCAPATN